MTAMQSWTSDPKPKRELPISDLSSLNIPLPLDQHKFSCAIKPTVDSSRLPNQLLCVGDLRWAQDSAFDSFSDNQSVWETLIEVVSGTKAIYRTGGPRASCLPTLRVGQVGGVWYSMDTRRLFVYKLAFHPDQLIPVFNIGDPAEIESKLFGAKGGNKDDGRSIVFKVRLHDEVPCGVYNLPFIRIIHVVDLADAMKNSLTPAAGKIAYEATSIATHQEKFAKGGDVASDPTELHASAQELFESALQSFFQAQSLYSYCSAVKAMLAQAAEELSVGRTLSDFVSVYKHLRKKLAQGTDQDQSSVKPVMRCLRDVVTWQAYLEQGAIHTQKFCMVLSNEFGFTWDDQLKSQFANSYGKCCKQLQNKIATGPERPQSGATKTTPGVMADYSSPCDSSPNL